MGQVFSLNPRSLTVENDVARHHNNEHGGGNDGGGSMLEARVAKLEANVEHIASDVTEIKQNLNSTSSNVSEIKLDLALAKSDISGINTDTKSLKQDMTTVTSRITDLEKSIDSFKNTIKVSAVIISAAFIVFGAIAGPYLAKIFSVINSLALKP